MTNYLTLQTWDKKEKIIIYLPHVTAFHQTLHNKVTIYTVGGNSFDISSDFEFFENLVKQLNPE